MSTDNTQPESGATPEPKRDEPSNWVQRLVLLRDHHLAKANVFTDQADDSQRDLDRLDADGDGPILYPGRWPDVKKYNEGLIAHERAQAFGHSTLAETAEMARQLLQNVQSEPHRPAN
jgi:hypothetical protein